MKTVLVTGGTGTLGRPTVERLRAAGHTVRVLSRRTGPDLVSGDLNTGEGVAAAVDGVDLVVHLATGLGKRDVQQTRNLLAAAPATTHVLSMSIVGIDRNPLPYYRHKSGHRWAGTPVTAGTRPGVEDRAGIAAAGAAAARAGEDLPGVRRRRGTRRRAAVRNDHLRRPPPARTVT
jgi:uncharacterized protein YbjT (DUF2867 family)